MNDDNVEELSQSANYWAQLGRDALNKSIEATKHGEFGSAVEYRKCADCAFEKELQLRELL